MFLSNMIRSVYCRKVILGQFKVFSHEPMSQSLSFDEKGSIVKGLTIAVANGMSP